MATEFLVRLMKIRKNQTKVPLYVLEDDVRICVNKNNQLMTSGSLSDGCMACIQMCRLGHAPPLRSIPMLEAVPALKNEKIIGVATDGEKSAVFAISEKKLWSFGAQQNGTLGNGTEEPVCYEPRLIYDLSISDAKEDKWVQLSAGMRHGAALTSSGKLFTWGWGLWGSGHSAMEQLTPAVPADLQNKCIVFVQCTHDYGDDGTIVVDDAGAVWTPKYDFKHLKCTWIQRKPIPTHLLALLGVV